MSKKINNYVRFIFAIFVLVCACILTVCCKKHTHKYTETIVPSTCTEQGYTLHKCSCGSEYKDDYQEIKSHRYDKYGVCSACGATKQIEVRAYVDGVYSQSVYTDSNSRYKITEPNKPEDITSNPNSEKYFYGWFTDPNFQTPLTENTTFRSNAAIYAKWITVYSNNFKYTVSYSAATITGYVGGAPTVLVIPSYVNSFPVEAIGVDAFKNETVIKTVIICDGIETISGFNGCNSITDIKIPKSVKTIGEKCFSYCGFSSFNIPNNVIAIGDYAFDSCGRLTNVTIPNSVTSIGAHAFDSCGRLTNVTIPNSVTSIGYYAFNDCSNLTSVTIPNGVTSIGYYAFNNCSNLTSVTIPNGVTSIGDYAFNNCSNLTSVTIPNGVTSIGDYAFNNCSNLTDVTIPNSVTSIGSFAFYGCSNLTSITIENGVTYIGLAAFSCCSNLTSVTIPNSVTYISYSAFLGCSSLKNVKWDAINCKTPTNSISGYYPNPIFENCPNLSTITIGRNVKEIPNKVFENSSAITNIYITDLKAWCNISYVSNLMTRGSSSKNFYLNNSLVTNLIIPDGVTSISDYAFNNCSNLTSVTIPNSVTSIGDYAFNNCSNLTSVTIPNGVTSIGDYTFNNCSNLTSVTIGNDVTYIGEYAFGGCSNLTRIIFKGTATQWNKIKRHHDWSGGALRFSIQCEDGVL